MVVRPAAWRLIGILSIALAGRAEAGFAIRDLGLIVPGGSSAGRAINSAGTVAGTASGPDGATLAATASAGGGFTAIPAPNASLSFATGINDSGGVAGTLVDATDGSISAFSFAGGGLVKFGPIFVDGHKGGATFASGIGSGGTVVGTGMISGRVVDGVYRPAGLPIPTAFRGTGPGSIEVIKPLGTGMANFGNGINGAGTVVGTSEISVNGPLHAFIADPGGTVTDLLSRNAGGSFAFDTQGLAINDRGDVVGSGTIGNRSTAFFASHSGGALVSLGLLGGSASIALGVNGLEAPVVVGQVLHGSSDSGAFIWRSDLGMLDLRSLLSDEDRLAWSALTFAGGINDSNQVAGTGMINGEVHGFLLTPDRDSPFFQPSASTPAPPALGMATIGGVLVVGAARLRRGRSSGRAAA